MDIQTPYPFVRLHLPMCVFGVCVRVRVVVVVIGIAFDLFQVQHEMADVCCLGCGVFTISTNISGIVFHCCILTVVLAM